MSENFEKQLTPEPQSEPILETEKTEQKIEEDLSPEAVERIMAKVQDIDAYGTAYHVVTTPGLRDSEERHGSRFWNERLEDVLKNGLLGTARNYRMGMAGKISPEEWTENVRKKKRGEVMFNIIGREFDFEDTGRLREAMHEKGISWIGAGVYMMKPGDRTAIIFDLSKFKEVEPRTGEQDLALPKHKTFHVDSLETKTNDRGELMSESGYGFSLYPRVAPRLFYGIVFSVARGYTDEEKRFYLERWGDTPDQRRSLDETRVEETDPQKLEERATEIATLMERINKDRPENLVPIYYKDGSLYWPKRLSHDEIKKMQAESEKQEKEYARTILEIGCGSAMPRPPWLENRNIEQYSNAHIVCTDIDIESIKQSKRRIEETTKKLGDKFTGKVEYLAADGKQLPFEEGKMDEVYLANILGDPRVTGKQKIISEATRVLSGDGELVIVEWATPDIALGLRKTDLYDEKAWEKALKSFVDNLQKFGLEVKAVEFPDYKPDLSLSSTDPKKIKETFHKIEEYLNNFPYAKKFVGGLIIPKVPETRPFVIVLKKGKGKGKK